MEHSPVPQGATRVTEWDCSQELKLNGSVTFLPLRHNTQHPKIKEDAHFCSGLQSLLYWLQGSDSRVEGAAQRKSAHLRADGKQNDHKGGPQGQRCGEIPLPGQAPAPNININQLSHPCGPITSQKHRSWLSEFQELFLIKTINMDKSQQQNILLHH